MACPITAGEAQRQRRPAEELHYHYGEFEYLKHNAKFLDSGMPISHRTPELEFHMALGGGDRRER
eukprot:14212242-Heterocapsa_arctica.AAC.1